MAQRNINTYNGLPDVDMGNANSQMLDNIVQGTNCTLHFLHRYHHVKAPTS